MRIAILKSDLNQRGGVEKYTSQLANAFVKRGCETTVLTTHRGNYLSGLPYTFNCSVLSLGRKSSLSLLHLRDFDHWCQQWLEQNDVDIVFGMDRNSSQTHYRAGNGVHRAYLERRSAIENPWTKLSFSLNPLHRQLLSLERQAWENTRLRTLFTNSTMVREEILQHYQVDPDKIQVVHNGVEWDALQEPFDKWDTSLPLIRQQLGLDLKRFQFLFIGHGYRRKGLEQLLRGCAHLPRDIYQLSVVGKDKDEAFFKTLVHKLKLENNVRFFGPQADTRCFYQQADALVIPSLYDPFANVTVEALAMGLSVVSSTANGGCEVLSAQTGLCIEQLFDPHSVAGVLLQALSRPKTKISAQMRRDSVKHLNFAQQLELIVNATLVPG